MTKGAALLHAILLVTLLAMAATLLATLLATGDQAMAEQVNATRALHLAMTGASRADGLGLGSLCAGAPAAMTVTDLGDIQFVLLAGGGNQKQLRVTGWAPAMTATNASRRTLSKTISCVVGDYRAVSTWQEVSP